MKRDDAHISALQSDSANRSNVGIETSNEALTGNTLLDQWAILVTVIAVLFLVHANLVHVLTPGSGSRR